MNKHALEIMKTSSEKQLANVSLKGFCNFQFHQRATADWASKTALFRCCMLLTSAGASRKKHEENKGTTSDHLDPHSLPTSYLFLLLPLPSLFTPSSPWPMWVLSLCFWVCVCVCMSVPSEVVFLLQAPRLLPDPHSQSWSGPKIPHHWPGL